MVIYAKNPFEYGHWKIVLTLHLKKLISFPYLFINIYERGLKGRARMQTEDKKQTHSRSFSNSNWWTVTVNSAEHVCNY